MFGMFKRKSKVQIEISKEDLESMVTLIYSVNDYKREMEREVPDLNSVRLTKMCMMNNLENTLPLASKFCLHF